MFDCKQLTGIFFSGKYDRFWYCLCAKFWDYFDFLPYIFNFPISVLSIDFQFTSSYSVKVYILFMIDIMSNHAQHLNIYIYKGVFCGRFG